MKIIRAAAGKLDIPLKLPFAIASGRHESLENVLFTVEAEGGVSGFGEGASSEHITGESREEILSELERIIPELESREMEDYSLAVLGQSGLGLRASLAAFEMAVLDARCSALGVPLWRFFGARSGKIKSDITLVMGDEKETFSFLEKAASTGFSTLKIKIGSDFDSDLKRVVFAAGRFPDFNICLDANCGFPLDVSVKFAEELIKKGVVPAVFEQPVERDDFEGFAAFTSRTGILSCADESADTFENAFRLMKSGCPALNIKLMKFGVSRAREIWNFAVAADVKLMMGEMLESPVSSIFAAHFAAGLGGFDFIDLDTPYFLKAEPGAARGIIKSGGVYDLSSVKSGAGFAPDSFS